ncbi:MAG: hypothetical protein EAZ18_13860 [Oscillatoriales cyanobacterium]|nr:MAG: hypothetical protein EAZ18_13860 [Oscillatoriales cyanobacterium]
MSVICGGSMPPQTAKSTLLNKNFMTATRHAILKLYSTRTWELSNLLDFDHIYCETGILPVQSWQFLRCLLDLDHIYCGTGILPVQDWQLLPCLSNKKDVVFVLDDSRAG